MLRIVEPAPCGVVPCVGPACTSIFRLVPSVSRRVVRVFPTTFCADPPSPGVQEMLPRTGTVSSKHRYPNTYLSSTNTATLRGAKTSTPSVSGKVVDLGYVGEEIVLVGVLHEEMLGTTLLGTKTHIGECGLNRILGHILEYVVGHGLKVYCFPLYLRPHSFSSLTFPYRVVGHGYEGVLHVHRYIHVYAHIMFLRWQLSIPRDRTWLRRCSVPRYI